MEGTARKLLAFFQQEKEQTMQYILDRIKEPSTWAGVAVLLTAIGIEISAEKLASIGAAIAAILSIVMRERK